MQEPTMLRSLTVPILSCLLSVTSINAADWPTFRGPHRNGETTDAVIPLEWGPQKNIRWKTRLPAPGNSSPIVVADRVFLSCAQDKQGTQRSLLCFDRNDGHVLWTKTVTYEQTEPTHDTNPYCAPTPASDGQRVIAWHGSAGLHCYDLAGNELWKTDLGQFRHIWGYAASPLIHNDRVFLNCGPGARSFVACLDKQTGKLLWQTDEPGGKDDGGPNWLGSWSTPLITTINGQDQLLIFQSGRVNAYDPTTGAILWTHTGAGPLAYTDVLTTTIEGTGPIALAIAGYGGKAIAFKLGGKDDTTPTHRLWQSTTKPPQRIGSGILRDGYLYLPNETGIECLDALTGKQLWFHRERGQTFWASLVATPDRIYATSQQGTTYVFAPDPTAWKLLATNPLNERTNSTPAPSNNQLFLRTVQHLYCIQQP
jgi:outer membrane protein assembly factor BamB